MNLIEFNNVTKIYRKGFRAIKVAAVTDLSFKVEQGTITGFVGPNGAGKTTSLKMIMGLARQTRGTILLNGIPTPEPSSRRNISFLPEQPYFYEHLTVIESLAFAYKLNRLPAEKFTQESQRVLDIVKLAHADTKKVKELSKGMQQRLSMACALLGNSNLYIFDEPMSGLDPLGRTLFRQIFRDLTTSGKTIFFSTHILDDIESLCAAIVVLDKGKLRYQGSITTILDQGLVGTDITVPAISTDVRDALIPLGCIITSPFAGLSNIFIPRSNDCAECQRILFQKNVVIQTIIPRRTSLETLLYG